MKTWRATRLLRAMRKLRASLLALCSRHVRWLQMPCIAGKRRCFDERRIVSCRARSRRIDRAGAGHAMSSGSSTRDNRVSDHACERRPSLGADRTDELLVQAF